MVAIVIKFGKSVLALIDIGMQHMLQASVDLPHLDHVLLPEFLRLSF